MEEVKGVAAIANEAELRGNGKVRDGDGRRESRKGTKPNKITWKGATFYTSLTYEEFVAHQRKEEDFLLNLPGLYDPDSYKEQSAFFLEQCLPIILENYPQMSGYEVEPMSACPIMTHSLVVHLNFKAKRKGAAADADSSASVYFVEYDVVKKKLMCLHKIQIDACSSDYSRCCHHCHSGRKFPHPYMGYVYHPDDDDTAAFLGRY